MQYTEWVSKKIPTKKLCDCISYQGIERDVSAYLYGLYVVKVLQCKGIGLCCSVKLVYLQAMFQVIILVVSIIFGKGSRANWIRKNQGNYSTGQESRWMIFKGMKSIYHTDQIDICNQFNSDCLSKYAWECCWDVECKHASWRYVNE